ncbi:uncharacterized protein LOC143623983 [Bidens hawaiensis]|uniref:uncharacterized protein LOC143623983 n=1 Tax=Bidens hawaiensis TaxID=980011 RepID=UPI00404AD834
MRGEWNGLQALVRNDCPYAYYVHCVAHRLETALACSSREVILVHQFFNKMVSIVNVVCASSKRHVELQIAKAYEVRRLLELGEIKSGSGKNQVGTLRRAADTRWGSHYNSVRSFLNVFSVTRVIFEGIIDDLSHTTFAKRGYANTAYDYMQSFEFVFILHLMKEVLGRTNTLSQALQKKTQDICNAMELVSSTKISLNDYRNTGWVSFLEKVTCFCNKHMIEMLDMSSPYTSTRYRPLKKDLHVILNIITE